MSHPLSATRLRRSASFRRLTGVSPAIFDQMLKQLRAPWTEMQRSKRKSGRPWEIGGLEEHLLVLLLYYRCYVTQEFIGFFYQVDRSVICRAIQRIEPHVKRLFGIRRAPHISRAEAEALIIGLHRAADPAAKGRRHPARPLLGQEKAPHPEERVYRHRPGPDCRRLAVLSRQPP